MFYLNMQYSLPISAKILIHITPKQVDDLVNGLCDGEALEEAIPLGSMECSLQLILYTTLLFLIQTCVPYISFMALDHCHVKVMP